MLYKNPLFPVFVLVLASVLWGLTWIPLKFINSHGFEGVSLLFVAQGLLTIVFLKRGWRRNTMVARYKPLLGIAIAGGSAVLCFTYALIYGDVIRVMVLFYLLPVWGVLGGKYFLNEKVDVFRWAGVLCAILGAFLILGGPSVLYSPPGWIDLLALFSGMAFAANNMVYRAAADIPLATKLLVMFGGCTVLSGGLLVFTDQSIPSSVDLFYWVILALYALVWLLLANVGSQWAVTQMEAGRSSIIIIVELISAVISAMILADERLNGVEWVGCFLVIVAAYLEATRAPEDNPEIMVNS